MALLNLSLGRSRVRQASGPVRRMRLVWPRVICSRAQRALATGLLTVTCVPAGSLAGSMPQAGMHSDAPTEYQVKAALLYNFARFVDWPPDAFQSEKAPITLCVFGHDPFGSALDEIIRGKMINSRELLARRINDLPNLKACQLVFISGRENKRLSEILNSLKGASALVVGESEGFAARGGGIQFFFEENKMRFSVNIDAVQRARLALSAKLLALARIVHDEGRQKGE